MLRSWQRTKVVEDRAKGGLGLAEGRPGPCHEREVVDAAVLLEHHQLELPRHPVELGSHLRAQRFATVEGDELLSVDRTLGEPDEQVVREGPQGDVEARVAGAVDLECRAEAVVDPSQVVVALDFDGAPALPRRRRDPIADLVVFVDPRGIVPSPAGGNEDEQPGSAAHVARR